MTEKSEEPTATPSKPPPKSKEQEEVDKALEAACAEITTQTAELDAAAKSLKRATSDSKMKAVRFPTPSLLDLDPLPAKR